MAEYEYVGLLVSTARRRIKQAVLSRMRCYRLAPQQFWMLVAMREHPALSQRELADRLRIDAPTASRVLASLAKRKLVRIGGDPSDRRRLRPRLTPAGAAATRELAAVAGQVRAAVTRGMEDDEVVALRASLLKVIANMERFESEGEVSEQAAPPIASPQRVGRRAVKERGACSGAAVGELADGESA